MNVGLPPDGGFVRIAVIDHRNHTDLPLERCAPGIDASRLLVEETGTPAASSEPPALE